jgi:hypothetical protein
MMKSGTWVIPTEQPSLADISFYYQLRWGMDISAGKGIYNLTGGGTQDVGEDVVSDVFNERRYPGIWNWFHAFEAYISSLPDLETTVEEKSRGWVEALRAAESLSEEELLVPTPVDAHPTGLDVQRGLLPGATVSVAPDDTGRDDPTYGTLVKIGVEEVVIKPTEGGELDVRIHFPRLGFVVKVVEGSKL